MLSNNIINPFIFRVNELFSFKENFLLYTQSIPINESFTNGIMTIPEGSILDFNLSFQNVENSVLVTGKISTSSKGKCVKCLKDLERDVSIKISEIFYFQTKQNESEDYLIENGEIDLRPLFKEESLISLEEYPVCYNNCRGLCSVCGIDLNLKENENHGHEKIDSRFEKLKEFLLD